MPPKAWGTRSPDSEKETILMIVCKIMADFDSAAGDFDGLFSSLAPLGAILCPGDAIFFASPLDPIDKKKVKRLLKKAGYADSDGIDSHMAGNAAGKGVVIGLADRETASDDFEPSFGIRGIRKGPG